MSLYISTIIGLHVSKSHFSIICNRRVCPFWLLIILDKFSITFATTFFYLIYYYQSLLSCALLKEFLRKFIVAYHYIIKFIIVSVLQRDLMKFPICFPPLTQREVLQVSWTLLHSPSFLLCLLHLELYI